MRFTKKLLTIALVLMMVFTLIPNMVLADDGINVTIDGQPVVFGDQRPASVAGRTLVPVRIVFEMIGFNVRWDRDTQTATITNADYELRITLGDDVFTVNGVPSPNRLKYTVLYLKNITLITRRAY